MLVLPAAVLAVHQLRYLLAYGSNAGSELSAHGDHYVGTGALIAGTLVAVSLVVWLLRLVAVSRGRSYPGMAGAPLWLLWLGVTGLLVAGFCAVEAIEIAFEPHHATGIAGIFGSGGWWALPTAAFVGGLMAGLVRGGRALLVIAARGRLTQPARITSSRHPRAPGDRLLVRPLASCAAGRAPPVTAPT
jgi:hypothetical protein